MKSLLLVVLIVLALPAWAVTDQPAPTQPSQPSIETLRAAIFSPSDPMAAPAGATWKSTCTVTNDCGPNSASVSCSSAAGNCLSGADFVECDGVRKNCAPCHVSTRCSNGRIFSCTGTSTTDCEVEPSCFVICSGHFFGSCPVCP